MTNSTPNWFRVEMQSGIDPYFFFGSTSMDESAVIEQLQNGKYVTLEDLVYFDENDTIHGWSEWDPCCKARVHLNPRHLVSIMPMHGDPRKKRGGDGSNLLRLPGTPIRD